MLLVGDIGVGKTTLLEAVQAADAGAFCPAPITLDRSPGSLQRALLSGLADATGDVVASKGEARQLGRRLALAAKRLAEDKGVELAKTLGRALVLKAREKVGAEAVDLVAEFAHELGEVQDEALLARILAEQSPSVADTLVALAGEVAEFAGENGVVIALNGGELLCNDDQRLLADLAPRLPTGVRLRVAMDVWDKDSRTNVEELLSAAGVEVLELHRLNRDQIRQWLVREHLDGAIADQVLADTDGYPLFIEAFIRRARGGEEPQAGSPVEQFEKRTRQAFGGLSTDAQALARQLSVLDTPLPLKYLWDAYGLTAAQWYATVEHLQRAGILTTFVNGVPWFHPARQSVIRGYLQVEEQAAYKAAVTAAVSQQVAYVQATSAFERTADVARLVAEVPESEQHAGELGSGNDLNAAELSVMAALIELHEPNAPPIDAEQVLLHARQFFGGSGDLIGAAAVLAERKLITTHETGNNVVRLTPGSFDAATMAVIQGRALLELGRLPLPSLVSSMFSGLLRPRLGPYKAASYGVGSETLLQSVQKMGVLRPLGGDVGVPLRGSGTFGVLHATMHSRPVSVTVSFSSDENRQAAFSRVRNLQIEFLGGPFEVNEVVAHPSSAVPAARLRQVLTRVLHGLGSVPRAADMDEYMEGCVRTLEWAYRVSTENERLAFDLPGPLSIHWELNESADRAALTVCEVVDTEPRSVRHSDITHIAWTDQFRTLRYAEAFQLREGQRIRNMRASFGRLSTGEPVKETLDALGQRAKALSATQQMVSVDTTSEALRQRLLDARTRELDDARRLAAAVPIGGVLVPAPDARTLYVCLEPPSESHPGLRMDVLETRAESGVENVHIAVGTIHLGADEDARPAFEAVFKTPITEEPMSLMGASATHGIAALLGYEPTDIMLVDASGSPVEMF